MTRFLTYLTLSLALAGCSTPAPPDLPGSDTAGAPVSPPARSLLSATGEGVWEAAYAGQRFDVRIDVDGLSLRGRGASPWSARLAVAEGATGRARSRDGRVEIPRGGFEEWYACDDGGVEQGFTFPSPPGPSERLRVRMDVVGDLHAVARPGRVELQTDRGAPVLAYGKLSAVDAAHADLPAGLSVEGGQIVIDVDARGARWPVTIDPYVWAEQIEVTPSDGAANDQFGWSVGLSAGFNTAVIGTGSKNAAYVFTNTTLPWHQEAKLTATGAGSGDGVGYAVGVDGDTIIVGAPSASSGAGAAYVFTRSGTSWPQQAKLVPSDPVAGDAFGMAVSVSGDSVLVGAPNKAIGAAYVFVRAGTTWTQRAKLTASDASSYDHFGTSVSCWGDTFLVGASSKNAAYVVTRSGTTYSAATKLVGSDTVSGDAFGNSVSVYGFQPGTAIIGAYNKNTQAGAAYVFTGDGPSWAQQAKLLPANPGTGDYFGNSVSVEQNTAVVGAYHRIGATGAAYIYTRTGSAWSLAKEITASDASANYYYGTAVAASGSVVVVGSKGSSGSGAAYFVDYGFANGDFCSGDWNCAGGHCVVGICCDRLCGASCSSCNGTFTGNAGTCSPVTAGVTDPQGVCGTQTPASCGTTGKCDGAGHCAKYGATTVCQPLICAGGQLTTAALCNGNGQCGTSTTAACPGALTCADGSSCRTSCTVASEGTDCVAGTYCDGAGACQAQKDDGVACGGAHECTSLQCVGAVCCGTTLTCDPGTPDAGPGGAGGGGASSSSSSSSSSGGGASSSSSSSGAGGSGSSSTSSGHAGGGATTSVTGQGAAGGEGGAAPAASTNFYACSAAPVRGGAWPLAAFAGVALLVVRRRPRGRPGRAHRGDRGHTAS